MENPILYTLISAAQHWVTSALPMIVNTSLLYTVVKPQRHTTVWKLVQQINWNGLLTQ